MSEKGGSLTLDKGGLGNLNVIGEESEDEGREDEIKELLAHAFSVETLGDDEEEDGAGSGDDLDDVDTGAVHRHRNKVLDIHAGGDQGIYDRDRGGTPGTVSLFHGSHCPTAEGDRNGNFEQTWASADGETLQELKTVAEFRERQAQRAEERVEILSKEKRALAHQLALLKTEVLAMKSTEEELVKTINLKDEQIGFFKEKVSEALRQFEGAKKNENETKDHNLRLKAQVEKLQQEVKLLSAIGLSTKETDLNDALRQTRQKHATELNSWRDKVAELELAIQKHEQLEKSRNDLRLRQAERIPNQGSTESEAQTSFDLQGEVKSERERHGAEKELWMRHLASLESRLQDLITKRSDCKSVQIQTEIPQIQTPPRTPTNVSVEVQTETESITVPQIVKSNNTQKVEVQVQTEETSETYRNLGVLIESWVVEVAEAEDRAVKAETEAAELTKGLKALKTRFRMIKKLVILCRKEWSTRENALIQRWNASEERFRNFLEVLGQSFATMDKPTSAQGNQVK